jgi:hypothetical protein
MAVLTGGESHLALAALVGQDVDVVVGRVLGDRGVPGGEFVPVAVLGGVLEVSPRSEPDLTLSVMSDGHAAGLVKIPAGCPAMVRAGDVAFDLGDVLVLVSEAETEEG